MSTKAEDSLIAGWVEEFKHDEALFESLLANVNEPFACCRIMFDEIGRPFDYVFLLLNDAFSAVTGIGKENIGKRAAQVVPSIGRELADWTDTFMKVAMTDQSIHFESQLQPNERWYSVTVYSPKKNYFAIQFKDITEHKRTHETVEQDEALYHSLFENMLEGISLLKIMCDEAGRVIDCVFVDVNPQGIKTLGVESVNKIKGKSVIELFGRDTLEKYICTLQKVKDSGKPLVVEDYFAPYDKYYLYTYVPFKQDLILHVALDITERKKAEEALKTSEERFRFALTNSRIFIANLNRNLQYTWAYNTLGGYTPDDVLGKVVGLSADPETNEHILKLLNKVVTAGESVHWETASKTKTGEMYFESHGAPLKSPNGEVTGVKIVSIDVTERVKLQEEIRRSEKKYRDLIEGLAEGVWVLDKDDKTTYVNQQLAKMLGYSAEEMLGKPLSSFMDQTGWAQENEARWRRRQGTHGQFDLQFIRKNGTRLFVLAETSVLKDEKNELVGTISGILDISERKRMEKALLASENRYHSLFTNMKSGFAYLRVIFDQNGKPVDYTLEEVNEAFKHIMNLASTQAILGRKLSGLYPSFQKDFPDLAKALCEAATTGATVEFESFVTALNKWFRISVFRPMIGYCAAVLDDETEMKRAQQQIEALAKFPLENPDPVLRTTRNGIITYSNPAASHILNLWNRKVNEPAPDSWCHLIVKTLDSGRRTEFEETYGTETFSFVFSPVKDYVNVYGHNVTERRKILNAIEESKQNFDALFNNKITGVAYCKVVTNEQDEPVDFVFLDVNDAYATGMGLKRENIVGKKMTEVIPGFARLEIDRQNRVAMTGEDVSYEFEEPHLKRWFTVNVFSPRKGYFVSISRDVSERKKFENALAESQADLSRAQAVAKIGSWRLNVQKNELLWSDETYRMFGVPKGTPMTYETFLAKVFKDDRDNVDKTWQAALRGKPYDVEHRIVVDRMVKWVRERAELEFDEDGVLLGGFGTIQDITERKDLAEKLRSAERLSGIGETAAMVGHDLRNPLQAIMGFVGLLEERLNQAKTPAAETDEFTESFEAIRNQINYMDKIVSDLQDYAQPLKPELAKTDAQKLIDETMSALKIPTDVSVSIQVQKRLPKARIDPVMLRRVLTNLANNALQAMPNGGKLTVKVSRKKHPPAIIMRIKDTGCGIPKADRSKIFSPLFTTKSKGQGFGLAVCKRLVEAHGGTISFKSQLGKGSIFTIAIPLRKRS